MSAEQVAAGFHVVRAVRRRIGFHRSPPANGPRHVAVVREALVTLTTPADVESEKR